MLSLPPTPTAPPPRPADRPIVVVGGGFTGAAVAFHLVEHLGNRAVTIVEPRPGLGAGVAYSTGDPSHRINVPAAKMSLVPSDPAHFERWLAATGALAGDDAAVLADGRAFPQRALFGRYVGEHLAPALAGGGLRHVREPAVAVARAGVGYAVRLASGAVLPAAAVVIATSHPPPEPPAVLAAALAGHPGFVPDPWAAGALAAVGRHDRVLVVGTGLTMADVVATLDRQGHEGPITAISRRGQRSRGHAAVPAAPDGDFATAPATTAVALLARIRAAVADAAGRGLPWQAVLDAVRAQGPAIWRALPDGERLRLLAHLRPFWDTHRFRIAPQVEAMLAARERAGTLEIRAARLLAAAPAGAHITATLRPRGGAPALSAWDRVVVTTGPAHDRIFATHPLLSALAAAGLARPDRYGLGIAVDAAARALGADGAQPGLFVAGPLARGTFGELMGLPEVAEHAEFVARGVDRHLALGTAPALGGG